MKRRSFIQNTGTAAIGGILIPNVVPSTVLGENAPGKLPEGTMKNPIRVHREASPPPTPIHRTTARRGAWENHKLATRSRMGSCCRMEMDLPKDFVGLRRMPLCISPVSSERSPTRKQTHQRSDPGLSPGDQRSISCLEEVFDSTTRDQFFHHPKVLSPLYRGRPQGRIPTA